VAQNTLGAPAIAGHTDDLVLGHCQLRVVSDLSLCCDLRELGLASDDYLPAVLRWLWRLGDMFLAVVRLLDKVLPITGVSTLLRRHLVVRQLAFIVVGNDNAIVKSLVHDGLDGLALGI